jgi:hypothetical protein
MVITYRVEAWAFIGSPIEGVSRASKHQMRKLETRFTMSASQRDEIILNWLDLGYAVRACTLADGVPIRDITPTVATT